MLGADWRAHIKDMHKELKFLTLDQRRTYRLGVECYKQVTNSESSLHKYFQPVESRRMRAGENKFKVQDIRSATGRKCFSFRGPMHWKSVEEELKNSENVNAFKKNYLDKTLRDVNHPT